MRNAYDIMQDGRTTTYLNGWTKSSIEQWVMNHMNGMRMKYNDDNGYCMEGNGVQYETRYTDHVPGLYPYTMSIYINRELCQVTRYE